MEHSSGISRENHGGDCRLTVCHVTSVHQSNDIRIFRKECSTLAAAGYETYLAAKGDSREENGVHVIGVGEEPNSRLKRMMFFTRKVYKAALALDCDIYQLHDPELLPYALKLKRRGKKVIFDSHENTLEQMEEKEWVPPFIRKIISSFYRRYATAIFRKLDCLISVTPNIIDQLQEINKNTWMITNYPIFVDYAPVDKEHEKFRLCFTGLIESLWSHKEVIETVGAVPDVEYELCGRIGFPSYECELRSLDAWDRVNYYGKVPFEKSIDIQRHADAGIALSKPLRNTGWMTGSIGVTKLFEYMMAGLPVICTAFDLWKDIIDRWQCGICVPPDDPKALEDAIIYLKNHPEEARRMGENGRTAAKEEFNWGTQEKKLLKLYAELGGRNE